MGLTRRFLFNDASWHGQCASAEHFCECIRFCMEVHTTLRRYGAGLEVGYNFRRQPVGYVAKVEDGLRSLKMDQRARLLVWLDRHGPFWDRPSRHSSAEYFECQEKVVTDTALAEAAHLVYEGESPVVVSLPGSHFIDSTLKVTWHEGPHGTVSLEVTNLVAVVAVGAIAESSELDFPSYDALIRWAQKECRHLAIVRKELLEQMGTTFIAAVAKRGRELLTALNSIAEALNKNDHARLTALCSEWFAGDRISDASASEKSDKLYDLRMRFRHPCSGEYIWCYWHGKVRTGVFRLHFEWPPPFKNRRLYVAYFGPKLTKK